MSNDDDDGNDDNSYVDTFIYLFNLHFVVSHFKTVSCGHIFF